VNHKELRVSLVVILFVFLGACSSTPHTKFVENEKPKIGHALVYIYRPSSFINVALKAGVSIDEELYVRVPSGFHAAVQLPAGTHAFSAGSGLGDVSTLKLNLNSGQIYYIKVIPTVEMPAYGSYDAKNSFSLDLASSSKGKGGVRSTKRLAEDVIRLGLVE